jgi:hypothetical protein
MKFHGLIFSLALILNLMGADPIQLPPAESLREILIDINSTITNKGDLASQMKLYSFGKTFEEWDETDFLLFQNAIRKYVQEGQVGRGPRYPDFLSQRGSLIVFKLKEAHDLLGKEGEGMIVLKDLQKKSQDLGRDFERGKIDPLILSKIQEWKKQAQDLVLHEGGVAEVTRRGVLHQIEDLEKRRDAHLLGEKRTAEQREWDRLREEAFQKEEEQTNRIRNGVMAVGGIILAIFFWMNRSGRGTD